MSGVFMMSSEMSNVGTRRKRLLKASVALPFAVLALSPAAAVQLITVNSPIDVGALNTLVINAANTPDPDITVVTKADGAVTGSGSVSLGSQGAGRGDGALILQNAGKIGSLTTDGAIADFVGVSVFNAKSFDGQNSGLITGTVTVSSISGPSAFSNTGTVVGGVFFDGTGPITLTSTGSVGSSGVEGFVFGSFESKTTDGVTTSVNSRNAASVSVANVGTKASRGFVSSVGGKASVEVTGIAGGVSTNATGTTTTVDGKTSAPAAGKTATTFNRTVARTGGDATATIGEQADISSLSVFGANVASAKVAGKVASNVSVTAGTTFSTTSIVNTETRNADNGLTGQTFSSISAPLANDAAANLTLAATASAGLVSVNTSRNATVAIDGKVAGNVSLISTTAGSSNGSAFTFDGKGNQLSSKFESADLANTGTLSLTVGAAGQAGSVSINGGGSAVSLSVAGKVASGTVPGSVDVSTNRVLFSSTDEQTFDPTTFNTTATSFNSKQVFQAGKLTVSVAQTGSTGDVNANAGADGATASIAGTTGGLFITANTTLNDNSSANSFDAKTGNQLSSQSTSLARNAGGPILVDVAGKAGTVSLTSGAGNVGIGVVGTTGLVQVFATGNRTATDTKSTFTFDAKGVQTGNTAQSSTTRSATGGTAVVTVATGGRIESLFASSDGDASLANSGTVAGNTSLVSARVITGAQTNSNSSATVAGDKQSVTTDTIAGSSQQIAIGGTATLINNAAGLIGDPTTSVSLNGIKGVSITNDGAIRGGLTASSAAGLNSNSFANNTVRTTVFAVDTTPAVTTTVDSQTSTTATTRVGGNIDARISGAIGTTNFNPATTGNVSLTGQGNVTASVVSGGAVFGSVTLTAGNQSSNTTSNGFNSTRVLGTDGKGSFGFTQTQDSTSVREGTSLASATIAGRVGVSNAGGGASVFLNGNNASLAVDGGIIDGSAFVTANGRFATESKFTRGLAQTTEAFVDTTTTLTETNAGKNVLSGGTATLAVSAGSVGGSSVTGVVLATANIAAAAKLAGSLSVSTSGSSSEFQNESKYSRSAGVVTASNSVRNVSSNVAGNSTATVAGTVGSSLNVTSAAGNASAALTGSAAGGVFVTASGNNTDSTTVDTYAGKLGASSSQTFPGLGVPVVGNTLAVGAKAVRTVTTISTATGGTATLSIETPAALQATGTIATSTASVAGLGGSTATIAAGSRVGSIGVGLIGANSKTTSVDTSTGTTLGTQRNVTSTTVNTAVGGASSLANAGKIDGAASVSSLTTASLTNSGRAGGGLFATAVGFDTSSTVVSTRFDNAALQVETSTTVRTPRLGTATITNAAGGVVGGIGVAGATGTVTNAGFITGTTTLGQSLDLGTRVTERTDNSNAFTYTAPDKRAGQTYTFDQNGIARAINVTGATNVVTNPFTGVEQTVQTSNIVATVNLNSGSVTLGNITAQTSLTGERLTDTTVNLRGSGWLGADAVTQTGVAPTRTPSLTLSREAVTEFGPNPVTAVRVAGVNLLRKQDAGTFVINGANFVAATSTVPAAWTLDVGTFAIDGGEVQLARQPETPASTFGIRGNVNNAATLVLGRRAPVATQAVGDSFVSVGPERIIGLTVNQTGNFTQTAAGTLVVGATGALTRFTPASVGASGASSELLGPLTGGVSIPYFTNAASTLAATGSTPSRIDVTGDLSLAGTIRVVVSRDSIFRDGDGTTLATYTGAGNVTATVSSSIASPFVTFRVVNDAATRTVRLVSGRTAYSTVAVGTNAQAAATALNSAIPAITTAILSDAAGGAAFPTVRALANAQDVANVVNALDWRLTSAQAAQVFSELSSGDIYASISAVDQNLVLNQAPTIAITSLLAGEALTSRLWATPVGDFSRFNGDDTAGASGIRSTAYGLAFGGDIAFATDGVIGIGASYGEHDVTARISPETARIRTWTVGAHVVKGFGQFYVQGNVAYGFSRFSVERELSLLSRSLGSEFRGTQLDAGLEAGYRFTVGNNWTITPFAKAAIRNWETNEAVEPDGSIGGGFALRVDEASKSIFRPTLGARINGQFGSAGGLLVRPLLNLSYTYQGDIGAIRTMRFAGGGDAFTVRGFSPDGFGTIETGVDTVVNSKLNMFVRGGYSFGGGNNAASIRAGLGFNF